jgi:small subunit ribosomal protein S5
MYTRCIFRLFTRKRVPVFLSSHVRNLDYKPTMLGVQRSDKYYDPDRMKKLNNLVREGVDVKGFSISNAVKRLAREDQEFNNFLKEFKAENEPKWSSVLECKSLDDVKAFREDLQKTDEERLAELHYLDQFRKRNISRKLGMALDLKQKIKKQKKELDIDKNKAEEDEFDEMEEMSEVQEDKGEEQEADSKIDLFERLDAENQEDEEEEEDFEDIQDSPTNYFNIKGLRGMGLKDIIKFDPQDFFVHFLDASSTTNVTKLFRVSSRRVLLYMGNGDGILSYGMGKGNDYREAFDKAVTNCKKNLIAIPLNHLVDCPGRLHGRYNDITVDIWPSQGGQFKCKPEYANLTLLAGLGNCRIRVRGANRNIYAITYAFFNAVRNNMTPQGIAEVMGQKVYQIGFESVHKPHRILPTRKV